MDDLQDEDIIGKKMTEYYPLDSASHLSIQGLKTGKPITKKTNIYYTRKKKLVNSLCSSFPLISKGKIEGVIHFSLNLLLVPLYDPDALYDVLVCGRRKAIEWN